MFITDFIKRKLATLLQPWLQYAPVIELKLGFLRSHVIVEKLSFDTSALNELLEGSSSNFYFADVTIDQLILRIDNWNAPAFNWEIRGCHVTISSRFVVYNCLFICLFFL